MYRIFHVPKKTFLRATMYLNNFHLLLFLHFRSHSSLSVGMYFFLNDINIIIIYLFIFEIETPLHTIKYLEDMWQTTAHSQIKAVMIIHAVGCSYLS
jgi:hypothetical protein